MTPTIECFEDQSTHVQPSASVLCGSIFYPENLQQTSATDKIDSRPNVRTNHQWSQLLRNRNPTCNRKRNNTYTKTLKPNVRRVLENLSADDSVVTEEHLDVIRKRTALLLVTVQTMILFHNNQILGDKLSALHKRVMEIQKDKKKLNKESASK